MTLNYFNVAHKNKVNTTHTNTHAHIHWLKVNTKIFGVLISCDVRKYNWKTFRTSSETLIIPF